MHYQQNFGHETVNGSAKYQLAKLHCDKNILTRAPILQNMFLSGHIMICFEIEQPDTYIVGA